MDPYDGAGHPVRGTPFDLVEPDDLDRFDAQDERAEHYGPAPLTDQERAQLWESLLHR